MKGLERQKLFMSEIPRLQKKSFLIIWVGNHNKSNQLKKEEMMTSYHNLVI